MNTENEIFKEFTPSFRGESKYCNIKTSYRINGNMVECKIEFTKTRWGKIKNWVACHNPLSWRFKTRNYKVTLPTPTKTK